MKAYIELDIPEEGGVSADVLDEFNWARRAISKALAIEPEDVTIDTIRNGDDTGDVLVATWEL